MSRFDHRNNKKRFDLYSFYALLVKCKIVELLDQSGKTPFDSESIDKNVSVYNAYVTQDAVDLGGALPYANNASVRQFLYSLDAQDGINDSENIITPGFNRTYYTLPLSDSEGTIEHTSVYTFLKSHFDRWLKYDPYERRKIASRIIDTLDVDSDLRYRYGDNFLIACEEDSDLSRRITEVFSNVMQTANDSDSESGHHTVRNEILKTTIKALRGLTPGGDSDGAVEIGHVLTAVLNNNSDSDSDIRNKFGDLFIDALRKDSDTADSDLQNRLRDIISNTELPFLESPLVVTRKLMPMDSDDTGSIGDSEFKFSLANFSTLRSDNVKIDGLTKDRLLDVSDSEGKLSDTQDNLQWQGDSELTVTHVNVTVDARLSTARVSDLSKDRIVYSSDSDGRTSTSSNLQWQGDSELVIPHLKVTNDSRLATSKVTDLYKDRIVYSSDSDGRLRTNLNIQFQNNDELVVTNLNVNNDSKFNATRVADIRKDGLVFVSDSDGRLSADSDLEFTLDSDKLVLSYQGRRQLAIDSDIFFNLLLKNDQVYTLDSEGVDSVIVDTPVKSETSWVIGQKGDVYFITDDGNDYIRTNTIGNTEFSSYFSNTVGGTWSFDSDNSELTLVSNPGSNQFYEANSTKPGGFTGAIEIEWRTNGYGFNGFAFFPTSAAAEDDSTWLNTQAGSPAYISTKTLTDFTYFEVGFVNGNNATTGAAYFNPAFDGTSKGQFNLPGVVAQYWNAPFPITFKAGRDVYNRLYVRWLGDGSTNTDSESPIYYLNAGGGFVRYSAGARTLEGPIQIGYGNYDNGEAEKFKKVSLTETTLVQNTLSTDKLVYITDKVIDTAAELARATNDRVTKLTVFNTWARFSHQYNGGGTPGTFNYPAVLAEEQGWAYDAGADVIYTTVNSVSYAGFVSNDTYQDFTFNSIFKTFNDNTNDDDVISSVIGFVTEGVKGQLGYREHTLQVIRNSGGFPMTDQNYGNVTWALVYNYNQDDVRLLVDKTTSAPVTTAPWNSYPNGTKVFIRRSGDIVKAYCSQMNDASYTLDSDTEIIWDLSSDSDTNKFRGPVRYGYGVHSQKGASWNDIVFKPDQGTYLHYIPDGTTGSSGGNVYEYNIDSERWAIDTSLTVDNTVGNRLLHNSSTRKTFFNNPSDDKVYQIMTASKFTDVMNLPTLSAEPALIPGTFAIADGVSWDPAFYGAPAYVTFWDGEYWYYVDAQ